MKYAAIKYSDIANGLGCRTVLFVSGCRNHCPNCFQSETWDFDYGEEFDEAVKENIYESLEPSYIAGLTLLGGEPFEPENQEGLLPFVKEVRRRFPRKTIWAYTGYVYDRDLVPGGRKYTAFTDELLGLLDVLVDGPYVQEDYSIKLKFRGSKNQRVIDMPKTLASGSIELFLD